MEQVLTLLSQAEVALSQAEQRLDKDLPEISEKLQQVLRGQDELKQILRQRKLSLDLDPKI